MLPTPKACFFDMDGTLLDSLADIADAANKALVGHGFPTHSYGEYRYLAGYGVHALLSKAVPENTPEAEVAALVNDMRAYYADMWTHKTRPFPGIVSVLGALAEKGLLLTILSNKPHPATEAMAKHFFPDTPFAEVRGQTPCFGLKPDPAAALAMAERLRVSPVEVFFVGDSRTDMETAVNAGMTPIGVSWGFRDAQELKNYGAAAIIDRPEDLPDLVGK